MLHILQYSLKVLKPFEKLSLSVLSPKLLEYTQIRGAKKKAAKQSKNKRKQTIPKYRGWKKLDGDYVEPGMLLYRQYGLKVYPGENVGCTNDMSLYALEPGTVRVSTEKLSPYPDSPLYPAVKAGRIIYKTFYHVILDPPKNKFRLVSQT